MTAPERIWAYEFTELDGSACDAGSWERNPVHGPVNPHEYTRTDLIPAMVAEAKADALQGPWSDKPDDLTDAVMNAHPFKDRGDFETYCRALELVSNRHSKGALVDLVNYLLVQVAEAEARGAAREREVFYIDCEFDGHNGPLLSIAMVRGDGYGLHIQVQADARDPWVIDNVVPIMAAHKAEESCTLFPFEVGARIRSFIGECQNPHIVADSPVDIGRFCRAISTGQDGGWASADYPYMTFAVHNIDCYPTTLVDAVQHNAWWDAMALRAAIRARGGEG